MKQKIDPFRVRKEKIKRNRGRPALKITKLYRVKNALGSMEFVCLHRAIDFMQRFAQDANLSVITLFGYRAIKVRRLI